MYICVVFAKIFKFFDTYFYTFISMQIHTQYMFLKVTGLFKNKNKEESFFH